MPDYPSAELFIRDAVVYATYEDFPLSGDLDKPVLCLVLQPEDGSRPTRVKADSPEADQLRKRYPDIPATPSAGDQAPAQAPAAPAQDAQDQPAQQGAPAGF